MSKKSKILVFTGIIFFIVLGSIILLQNRRIITMPCFLNWCLFGGTCARYEGKTVCLNGYKDGTICNYCESGECEIGESFPLYFNCRDRSEKGLGATPSSKKLQNQFCKDNDSGVEISYQEAIEIAQKDKCGLKGDELITFSEKYLCNENTGTWWVDLNVKPERKGCSPACVVYIVDKTAEVNWRCTGLMSSQQKIYENNIMGIKFTYPSVLIPESLPTKDTYTVFFRGEEDKKLQTSGIIKEKPQEGIGIHYFTNRKYQEEVDRVISNIPKNRKISDITFKSYPAKEITGNLEQFGITLKSKHVVVNKNGIIYSLGVDWYSDANIENYYNQIITSLEFTN